MSEPQLKKARHNEDMISFEDIFDANVIDEVNEYESEYSENEYAFDNPLDEDLNIVSDLNVDTHVETHVEEGSSDISTSSKKV